MVFNPHKFIIQFSIFLTLIYLSQSLMFACTCFSKPPCQEFANNDVVFVGRVITGKRERVPPDKSDFDKIGTWQCEVIESFKGISDKQVVIYTQNYSVSDGWCDRGSNYFEVGKTYLFYAFKNDGKLFTRHGFCSRTKEITPFTEKPATVYDFRRREVSDNLADDFAFLRNLDPQRRGSFQGMIFIDAPQSEKQKDMQAIKMRLVSNNFKAEVFPERDGYFIFQGLLPSEYNLEIIRPQGYLLENDPKTINIRDCSCGSETYQLTPVGRLKGHLSYNDGRPIQSANVYLLPVASWKPEKIQDNALKSYNLRQVTTNENGDYEFKDIKADDYRLGVSLTGATPNSPFNRIFYPQTSHSSHAKIISVKRGQSLAGYDFQLKQVYETFSLSGEVVWADGTLAKDASVQLNQPISFYADYSDDRATVYVNEQGQFTINGLKGHKYQLVAEWHHEQEVGTTYDFGYARSGEFDLVLKENQKNLRLVFPNPAPKLLSAQQSNNPPQQFGLRKNYRAVIGLLFAVIFPLLTWGSFRIWKYYKS